MDLEQITFSEEALSDALASALIAFSRDWEAEGSCWGYRANAKEDIEGRRIFLAREDDRIVGYLFGLGFVSENMRSIMPEGTPCFEAEELYIVPEMRRKGLGAKLFRFAAEAVSDAAEYVVLSTAVKNWRAILHFYLDELDMEFWSARLFKKLR